MRLFFILVTLIVATLAQTYNVQSFGAINDGVIHNNTAAFSAAVKAASSWFISSGGEQGTVLVSGGGEYLCGRIELLSGVILHVDGDTVLKASANVSDYSWGRNVWAFLYSSGATDLTITGGGVVDGNYEAFIGGFNETWDEFIPLGWPNCSGECRPRLAMLTDSIRIDVHDVTFRGSPDWTFHVLNCSDVHIYNWTQIGDHRWPNNDGIDIDSSSHVLLENSTISTGDDGVCIKGSAPNVPVFNVTVRNCTISSRSSAIKFGSNNPVPTHSLLFEDILVLDSNRALALQTRDGGDVYDIVFRRIVINETRFWPFKWWGDGGPLYISSMLRDSTDTGCNVYNVTFENITSHSQNAAVLSGLAPGKKLTNITLRDVTIVIDRLPHWNYSIDTTPAVFPNIEYDPSVVIHSTRRDMSGWMPGLYVENVEGLLLDGLTITFVNSNYQKYWGSLCVNTSSAGFPVNVGRPTVCTPPHQSTISE
jgi:polygalacturonase